MKVNRFGTPILISDMKRTEFGVVSLNIIIEIRSTNIFAVYIPNSDNAVIQLNLTKYNIK